MESGIKNALIAGICFIGVSGFMLAIPAFNASDPGPSLSLFVITIALALYGGTLIWHLDGYAVIGELYSSRVLSISSRALMWLFGMFIASVVATVFAAFIFGGSSLERSFGDASVGLSMTLMAIPALAFAYSLISRYREFGSLTVAAACVVPIAVFFMWRPWLPILFVALSSYFLYRIGSRRVVGPPPKVWGGTI